jgi:hypothetical protein
MVDILGGPGQVVAEEVAPVAASPDGDHAAPVALPNLSVEATPVEV